MWLIRRLEVARRGANVLEQKRSTLLNERLRLTAELARASSEWERKASTAAAWNARASTAAGPRALRLAALRARTPTVTITERNVLGTVIPVSATVDARDAPGGMAAIGLAAEAHAEALSAAAALAAVQAAHQTIDAELRRTARRLRAIEHRWIPQHEAELRRLELSLDEAELADIARARWAAGLQR